MKLIGLPAAEPAAEPVSGSAPVPAPALPGAGAGTAVGTVLGGAHTPEPLRETVVPFPLTRAVRPPASRSASDRAAQLGRDAVLSATPVQLLTMLYDRLLLDLGRAEQAQLAENWAVANEQLQHAQAILTELSGSLRVDVWDGAEGLLALYTYVTNALVLANIHRDVARTREAIELLEPMRLAWHDAAEILPGQAAPHGTGALGIA